jgi:ectoine hydroxylase-related dioxygenase (phytanoyl-CoA dioxygenase family)
MPMPDLTSEYPLTNEQIAEYKENGHIVLRGVCSTTEIEAYRNAIVEAAMRNNSETRPLEERDTYGKAFLQIMNLWTLDQDVRGFTLSKRFASIAAKLMDADRVRLYHDQALFKEPGGGHTPWHQDQFYWPLQAKNTTTMWMPLVNISAVMGSMSFADGSQNEGYIPVGDQISDNSEAFFDRYTREQGFPISGGGAMQAGDASFHSGWTLHRAPGNSTDVTREAMTIIYFPDGTRVAPPENQFQEADHRAWLGGVTPGEPADGPLNPIVYP